MTNRLLMETQNLVISFDYSWFLAKKLAYAECRIMKFHYRNSSIIYPLLNSSKLNCSSEVTLTMKYVLYNIIIRFRPLTKKEDLNNLSITWDFWLKAWKLSLLSRVGFVIKWIRLNSSPLNFIKWIEWRFTIFLKPNCWVNVCTFTDRIFLVRFDIYAPKFSDLPLCRHSSATSE